MTCANMLGTRWFVHDPTTYPDPKSFKPERFLGEFPETDPREYIFGFGRRRCPGRLLADSSVWLTIAKTLAAFDIRQEKDAEGKEVQPEVRFSAGVVSHPVAFKADIKPRSQHVAELVRAVEQMHPWIEGRAQTSPFG